jgi:hypothetical protein
MKEWAGPGICKFFHHLDSSRTVYAICSRKQDLYSVRNSKERSKLPFATKEYYVTLSQDELEGLQDKAVSVISPVYIRNLGFGGG